MSLVTCVRCAMAYCIGSSLAGISRPPALDAIQRLFAGAGGHRDVDVRRQTQQAGERVVGGDEPAIGIVCDGDRHGRASDEVRERAEASAQVFSCRVVRRLE